MYPTNYNMLGLQGDQDPRQRRNNASSANQSAGSNQLPRNVNSSIGNSAHGSNGGPNHPANMVARQHQHYQQQLNTFQMQMQFQAMTQNGPSLNNLKSPTANSFGFQNPRQKRPVNGASMFANMQPPVNQQVAYGHLQKDSVPQTPFDLNYGQSMLPRNLLISSPFVGSPMTAALSPGASFQSSRYVPVSGPAPPIIGAPPKPRKKVKEPSHFESESKKENKSEDGNGTAENGGDDTSESDPEIITEAPKLAPSVEQESDSLPTKALARYVIVFHHMSPSIKVYEFLNFIKFGPLLSCEFEEINNASEIQIKLKFIYQLTHDNFIHYLQTHYEKFRQEFKSPLVNYSILDNAADDNEILEDGIDLEYEIQVNQATRCIKIPKFTTFDLLNDDQDNLEKKLRLEFGELDVITTNEDRNNSLTIHFLDILSAIKLFKQLTVLNLEKLEKDASVASSLSKFKFSADRCCQIDDEDYAQSYARLLDHPEDSDIVQHDIFIPQYQKIMQPVMGMNELSNNFQAMTTNDLLPPMMQNVNNLNASENRTVYLGNLTSKTTVEEICNVVRGGILQSIKLMSEKHICFITFISAASATQFYASSNMNGLSIHNKKIKVGWGKNPGELPNSIALAVTVGASRNVYIGVKEEEIGGNGPRVVPDEAILRKDFSKWGDIEQINFFKDGYCAFVNFMNITSAMKAIEDFQGPESQAVHQSFNNRYSHYKINFAKDRCGNPPKFSNKPKKKKKRNVNNSISYSEPIEGLNISSTAPGTAGSGANNSGDNDEDGLTNQKALALASIGIGSTAIDEKVKEEESTTQEKEETSTIIKPVSSNRHSLIGVNSSPARSVSPVPSNGGYGYQQQTTPQQFTPIQQNAQLYQGDFNSSPNGYMQQNMYMPKSQSRRNSNRSSLPNSSGLLGGFGNSGSTVMAQYLAKAQFDSLMFNPSKEDKKKKKTKKPLA